MASTTAQTKRQHARNVANASATIDAYKVARGCVDCGFNRWPEALHFDHSDPTTKRTEHGWQFDKGKLRTRAKLEAFLAHVEAHCEVRCANCHAHRSKVEKHHHGAAPRPPDGLTLFDVLPAPAAPLGR